ncbi:hypothetical protein [Enterococcus mundtii]|uniref:hypothetical protein n=1 Tax=Enterococcus mundtii TaxID=53346 RepID=UPI001A965FE2|nr:hypothetical protein [Enterococcus mundtii]MBO1087130.1 hypothetical protein [Enterococcus mundtii]
MKKSSIALTSFVTLATIVNIGVWAVGSQPKEVKADKAQTEGIVFENENVAIKYYDVENGTYDILVETKNDTNISSEYVVEEGHHYNSAYLVGMNKDHAKKFYDTNLKPLDIEWTWEDNYEIDR